MTTPYNKMEHIVRVVHATLSNLPVVGLFGFMLVVIPAIGIIAVHEAERPR